MEISCKCSAGTKDIAMDEGYISYIHSWFEDYANQFHSSEPEMQRNIALKLKHTLRVRRNISKIAVSLNLGQNALFLAETIGLFHDVGRFEQLKMHRTFNDRVSVDHATLGLRILDKHGVLSNLTERERNVIRRAIWFHNKYEISENEHPDIVLFSRMIRDADKLDILGIITDYYERRTQQHNSALDFGLSDAPDFSGEFIQDIISCRMVKIGSLKNLNDLKLMYLSWVFDINFPVTIYCISEGQYMEKLINFLPRNDDIRKIEDHIKEYIENRRLIQI